MRRRLKGAVLARELGDADPAPAFGGEEEHGVAPIFRSSESWLATDCPVWTEQLHARFWPYTAMALPEKTGFGRRRGRGWVSGNTAAGHLAA
jgi:hypothetical protein